MYVITAALLCVRKFRSLYAVFIIIIIIIIIITTTTTTITVCRRFAVSNNNNKHNYGTRPRVKRTGAYANRIHVRTISFAIRNDTPDVRVHGNCRRSSLDLRIFAICQSIDPRTILFYFLLCVDKCENRADRTTPC